MNAGFFKRLGAFVLLCIVQILVLNNIHLFGCATPLLYVMFVLSSNRNYPRWAILLWCFTLGLVIDISSNTPGLAAGTMTLLGLLQPYILIPFIPRDSAEDFQPTMRTLGFVKFMYYTMLCVFIYSLCFFSLEVFSFFNWRQWLFNMIGSWALTVVLILVIENVIRNERREQQS